MHQSMCSAALWLADKQQRLHSPLISAPAPCMSAIPVHQSCATATRLAHIVTTLYSKMLLLAVLVLLLVPGAPNRP